MNKNIIKTLLLLPAILLWGGAYSPISNQPLEESQSVMATILITKIDFDVYRVRIGNRKNPTYYYEILPAPDTGIAGPELEYLGQIPAGARLKIVELRKGRLFSRATYQVRPLSPISQSLKAHPRRESVKINTNLDSQIFQLRSTASPTGIYARGKYPDGSPRLNETLFEIIPNKE